MLRINPDGSRTAYVGGYFEAEFKSPSASSNLAVATLSSSQLRLTWQDNSSNESGFKIERSPNGTSGWWQIATVGANTTSFTDWPCLDFLGAAGGEAEAPGPGTYYYYRGQAYNGNGNSGYSNVAIASAECIIWSLGLSSSLDDSASVPRRVPGLASEIGFTNGASAVPVALAAPTPPSGQTWRSYYYAGSQRVAMRERTNSQNVVYYLHTDHLGSTSLATHDNGQKVTGSRTLYYPYGEVRWSESGGTLPTDYGFTGQRHEASLGLYDYHARFYDAVLGRFISADTIVPEPGNPQDLNRYAYVRNNPVKYTDPSGHAVDMFRNSPYGVVDDPLAEPPSPEKVVETAVFVAEATIGVVLLPIAAADAVGLGYFHLVQLGAKCLTNPICAAVAYGVSQEAADGDDDEARLLESASEVIDHIADDVVEGEFSITDWSGYPSNPNVPKPQGPFRLLEGAEKEASRAQANAANRALHRANPALRGLHIHEIHPVKFGGSPTDLANKVALTPTEHMEFTRWWNALQRALEQ